MKFDCIIIGGGIAGLTCGIKCATAGLHCAIISSGMSALHFSSGSIDLLSYYPGQTVVYSPFDVLGRFISERPAHPYAKCGPDTVEEALLFFKEQVGKEGIEFCANDRKSHFHITALGTLKPTFYSQKSVYNPDMQDAFLQKPKIGIVNVAEFRDFNPDLVAANLKTHSFFKDCDIVTGSLELGEILRTQKNPHEFRSIDIARIFDSGTYLESVAEKINHLTGDSRFVGMPAFLGISNFNSVYSALRELTGKYIYEIPTLPPSILGMRLDDALKSRFADLGGVFIAGDRVVGGEFSHDRLKHIFTQNYGDNLLRADCFVLATGSFFSGGLSSRLNSIKEPVFDLALDYTSGRKNWYSSSFLDPQSHPFLEFGVRTNEHFNPIDNKGGHIQNLFCIGAVLANYNPVKEGSGSGVAIGSAYRVAKQIIDDRGHKSED